MWLIWAKTAQVHAVITLQNETYQNKFNSAFSNEILELFSEIKHFVLSCKQIPSTDISSVSAVIYTVGIFCICGREPSCDCTHSAVCAYKLSDISQVFSGRFLTELDTGNWDIYTGQEPSPYPGSVSIKPRLYILTDFSF